MGLNEIKIPPPPFPFFFFLFFFFSFLSQFLDQILGFVNKNRVESIFALAATTGSIQETKNKQSTC